MDTYDANHEPDPNAWLELDEGARIGLVVQYHRRHRRRTPRVQLHATFHVVVENEIAAQEHVVVDTLNRLRSEGLSRHDAVHAIGSVLAAQVYDILRRGKADAGPDPNDTYGAELRKLTAESWQAG